MTMQKIKQSEGFTIIELAIVMLIFGFMIGGLFFAFRLYNAQTIRGQTNDALSVSKAAYLEFFSIQGRYPCPADPTLGPNDAGYGLERCNDPSISAVRIVPGERDTNSDPDTPDSVMIGSIPFATMLDPDGNPNTDDGVTDIPLSESKTIDGWGRKLTYAVTQSLTQANTFNDSSGVIDIVDENNQSVLGLPQTAHYALISGGENGEGAYTREGTRIGTCANSIMNPDPDAPPPVEIFDVDETENCNNINGKFAQALRNDNDADFYDDEIDYSTTTTSSFWLFLGPQGPNGEFVMHNVNPGNIGIGLTAPQERLHVQGDLKATAIEAAEFCDPDNYNSVGNEICMPSSVVGGSEANMRCANNGEAVTQIQQNSTGCQPVFTNPASIPVPNRSCPPGQVITGISNINGVICADINL